MSRKATIIYLALAPVLFLLSWYISHRMYTDFLSNGVGNMKYEGKERSEIYAAVLTGLYLAAFFVIRDLYRPGKKS
jgi:TRAP-type C4-dicarboxylate transport system permease small subunit